MRKIASLNGCRWPHIRYLFIRSFYKFYLCHLEFHQISLSRYCRFITFTNLVKYTVPTEKAFNLGTRLLFFQHSANLLQTSARRN